MNIKDKITEWQDAVKHDFCINDKERAIIDAELEMVLFAIDKLTDLGGKSFTQQEAIRIRLEASNCYCSDSEFLDMINKESK